VYRLFPKRIVDLVIGSVALILSAPLLLLVALAVRVSMGSPILFRQTRAGLLGSPFEIMKFRTMGAGVAADDASRLTRTGRLLRSMTFKCPRVIGSNDPVYTATRESEKVMEEWDRS